MQTFRAKQRRQHREALSLLPSPPSPSLLGPSQLQPQPCSYCWGKQKTTAMWHQTGLHHVYAMTEDWAQLQRDWGSDSDSDSPSTSKAVLWRLRGLKGPWRSLPPNLSFRREAQRQGVSWPRSCRILRSGLGNLKGRSKLRLLVGVRGGGVSYRFMGGCYQLLLPPPLVSNQLLAFSLRSLNNQGSEGRGGQASELNCRSFIFSASHLGRYKGMRTGGVQKHERAWLLQEVTSGTFLLSCSPANTSRLSWSHSHLMTSPPVSVQNCDQLLFFPYSNFLSSVPTLFFPFSLALAEEEGQHPFFLLPVLF